MKNSNQPAFPLSENLTTSPISDFDGLTKREYFAGLILQGMLSGMEPAVNYMRHFAEIAVMQADALLAELETTNQPTGETHNNDNPT